MHHNQHFFVHFVSLSRMHSVHIPSILWLTLYLQRKKLWYNQKTSLVHFLSRFTFSLHSDHANVDSTSRPPCFRRVILVHTQVTQLLCSHLLKEAVHLTCVCWYKQEVLPSCRRSNNSVPPARQLLAKTRSARLVICHACLFHHCGSRLMLFVYVRGHMIGAWRIRERYTVYKNLSF